ncbi:hypothetical protein NF212_06560 [Parasalinivibrio latis]|uniref:hypothetical protein n=1 Tax=Parasalinivibrio latis TaxID=2952610 RepID=UPI0030E2BD39
MADLNDLNQPGLDSDYATEVLQTLKGHIVRLWGLDYSGMTGLQAGMKRLVKLQNKHVRLLERQANGTEVEIFNSSEIKPSGISDVPGLQEALDNTGTFGAFTVSEVGGVLHITHNGVLIFKLDSSGNLTLKGDAEGMRSNLQ